MEHLTNDRASAIDVLSGRPDQHESPGARELLRARANRLYELGEIALAAQLLMGSEASSWPMGIAK
jgi:hypothetical protein